MSLVPDDASPEEVDRFLAALEEADDKGWTERGDRLRTLQEANAALAARVRELEESVGELLGYVNGCPCAFMEAFMRAGEGD